MKGAFPFMERRSSQFLEPSLNLHLSASTNQILLWIEEIDKIRPDL